MPNDSDVKITVDCGGYVVEVWGKVGHEARTASSVVSQLQALDAKLEAAGIELTESFVQPTAPAPLTSPKAVDDEELVLTWLAKQEEPRSRTATVKDSPPETRLTARRTKLALERLLEKGTLELRNYDYIGKDTKVRSFDAIYFTESEPPSE